MEELFSELVFSSDIVVQEWLEAKGHLVENDSGSMVVKSPNHKCVVGFNWNTLDCYTRLTQLNFAVFGGHHFIDATKLVTKKYKELHVKNKKI